MMRNLAFSFAVISSFTVLLSGCSKKHADAEVVKDCTGTYLRIGKKDFLVCNYDLLSTFKIGEMIEVDFHKESDCTSFPFSCELYHPYETTVIIDKIY